MLNVRLFPLAALAISLLGAKPFDPKTAYDLIKKGHALSAQNAAALEERLVKKPADAEARVQLMAYYSGPPAGADLAAVKAARIKHILWLLEKDPKEGFGLFQISTGIHDVHCRGDELADPQGFEQVRQAWTAAVQKNPKDTALRRRAAIAIQYCAPEQAEEMFIEGKELSALGDLYANAVLGVTGESYEGFDPAGTDAVLRSSPFAEKARRILESVTDADTKVVSSAAYTLLRTGATLWADGKLDWDYTKLGNNLLARAQRLAPNSYLLRTVPTTLPAHGERPAQVIRVGGNVQSANLIRKVAPLYPALAKDAGIQGTVVLSVVIGLDGNIIYINPVSGPRELIDSSVEAARQWQYRPTLLNGKPCYAVTTLEMHYNLSQ